jgi:small subunit ribosomal protein S36
VARVSRRARTGALTLVTVLWATVLLGWLQLTPLYRAADETLHVDLLLHVLDGEGYPPAGALELDPEVRASYPLAGLSSEERPELASLYPLPLSTTDVPPREQSFDELDPLPGLPDITNQMTQHPPLYYGLVAGAASLVPGFDDRSFVTQVGLLRLLSASLLLPLPLLAAAAARRLGAAPPVATAAALLPLAVPQLAHVGASLNNDVLLVLLGAAVAPPLLAVARGDASRRTAGTVGVLLGLALLTKALAVGLLVWAALAYVVALLGPARAQRATVVGSALLAAAVALAVGGWWWVVNLVRYGTVQPSGTAPLPAIDTDPDLLDFTWSFLTRVTASTWGSFGWLEVQVPGAAQLAGLVVVLLGLAAFLLRRPAQPWARAAGATAVAGFALQTAVIYQQSLKNYLRGGYLAGLQGRYLFAFVAVLAAVVAVGLAGALPARARRWAPLVALAAVLVMQAVGVVTALHGFWWPDGEGLRRALAIQSAWAPFPRWTTLLTAVVGAAAAVLLVRAGRPAAAEPAGVVEGGALARSR